GIHNADHFMARHARILQAWPVAFLDERIAMANATSLDLDPHPTGGGLGNFAFNNFERPIRAGDLGDTHLCHNQPRLSLVMIGLNFQKVKCLFLTKGSTWFLLTLPIRYRQLRNRAFGSEYFPVIGYANGYLR